ncbi:hypothetical protein MMC22_001522 [Lobaria immixta]|nr:hypothetical protein [Lobaria immixta]
MDKIESMIYLGKHGKFQIHYKPFSDSEKENFWTLLRGNRRTMKESENYERILEGGGSSLTAAELGVLHPRASANLFPSLVNHTGDIRTRALKSNIANQEAQE